MLHPDQANILLDLAIRDLTFDGKEEVVATPVGTPAEVADALAALDDVRSGSTVRRLTAYLHRLLPALTEASTTLNVDSRGLDTSEMQPLSELLAELRDGAVDLLAVVDPDDDGPSERVELERDGASLNLPSAWVPSEVIDALAQIYTHLHITGSRSPGALANDVMVEFGEGQRARAVCEELPALLQVIDELLGYTDTPVEAHAIQAIRRQLFEFSKGLISGQSGDARSCPTTAAASRGWALARGELVKIELDESGDALMLPAETPVVLIEFLRELCQSVARGSFGDDWTLETLLAQVQEVGRRAASEAERYGMIIGEDLDDADDPLTAAMEAVRSDRRELLRLGRELEVARDHARRLFDDLAARPDSLRATDVGMFAAALAPGEAPGVSELIARARAYRMHSIELAAIGALLQHKPVCESPFPWDACPAAVAGPREQLAQVLVGLRALHDAVRPRW